MAFTPIRSTSGGRTFSTARHRCSRIRLKLRAAALSAELATIALLEHALDLAAQALLAEHPTLADDFARTRDDGPVLTLANTICRRAAALEQALRRYRQAVHDAVAPSRSCDHGDDLPF